MTNKELQIYLATYPDDMPIKLNIDYTDLKRPIIDFTEENIMLTAMTAYCNSDAPEEEWDTEDGKVELGDGEIFLLFNPIII